MEFAIYQVKEDFLRELGFVSIPGGVKEVDLEKYNRVYVGRIKKEDSAESVLDKLFTIFNIDHPAGYTGRSLSVSDVVLLDGQYYYCCTRGWKVVQVKKGVRKSDGSE